MRLILRRKRPGVVVVVDGLFHESLAVGHAELREALARGWQVWGVASMGAIRAREMRSLGMRGFGSVFERFLEEADFQDDEVALLHEPTAPYTPLTEPLVHLRAAAKHLVASGLLSDTAASAVLLDLKARWFGERTLKKATDALAQAAAEEGGAPERIRTELRTFDRFQVKRHDLEAFLARRPWLLDGDSEIV
jgi:hypothetical protein